MQAARVRSHLAGGAGQHLQEPLGASVGRTFRIKAAFLIHLRHHQAPVECAVGHFLHFALHHLVVGRQVIAGDAVFVLALHATFVLEVLAIKDVEIVAAPLAGEKGVEFQLERRVAARHGPTQPLGWL